MRRAPAAVGVSHHVLLLVALCCAVLAPRAAADLAADRDALLALPGVGLAGTVPVGTIGNLTALRSLSLRHNALSGGIPADIGSCAELRTLFLQGNRFDGEIPEGIFRLRLLQRLDLSDNQISGGVSPEFSNLQRLDALYLQNNRLNGTLPVNLDLPDLRVLNLSNNGLVAITY
ncbi:unnamed protein product [Urochloa decumbens]|uniref:Uncharacterized protein n=1 Tax=Urochloa decumbens TaxID=240449 RepID=A0ABC9FFB3_9POAL